MNTQPENYDIFLKFLAPLLALMTLGWGVYQYRRSNELAFRKPYWEKLLALYIDATSSVSILASTTNKEDWEKARAEFWRLYYGPLCLVENKEVESAMVYTKMVLPDSYEQRDVVKLRKASQQLALACRNSIRTDWDITMETLAIQTKYSALSLNDAAPNQISDKNQPS